LIWLLLELGRGRGEKAGKVGLGKVGGEGGRGLVICLLVPGICRAGVEGLEENPKGKKEDSCHERKDKVPRKPRKKTASPTNNFHLGFGQLGWEKGEGEGEGELQTTKNL